MEKFFQALAALLPTGFAWPRDAGSTLMRVIRGLAATFSEHHDFTTEAVRQWQPGTTVNRLAEWEEATGLPDACFPTPLELLLPGRYAVDAGRIASTTRATTATYRDDAGTLQIAAVNVARFEGGVLVVEPLEKNWVLQSEDLTAAIWTKQNVTVTANTTLAPDGQLTADTVTNDATNSEHRVYQNFVTGALNSTSVYLKAGTANFASLGRGVNSLYAVIDLTSGAVVSSAGCAPVVTPAANGFWRLDIQNTSGIDISFLVVNMGETAAQAVPQAASVGTGKTIHVWGGGGRLGAAAATSYIPTTTVTVTRAADQIYLFPTEAATRTLRRKLLLSRLRGPVLAYSNSSPACTGAIVAICAGLGYVATVAYNTPFRCGVNRVGDRLGALDGKLYVTVTLQSNAFRVGVSRVGQRLLEGQLNGGELACYLQRVIPARFQLNMIFI